MIMKAGSYLRHTAHDMLFKSIHSASLIYNTCWEDPRIDRELLQLNDKSKIALITSAGCNALDYLLDNPAQIHCIDVNARQNALLQLKTALISHGDHEQLFALFGQGAHPEFKDVYYDVRRFLPDSARRFWDGKISYFSHASNKQSFYYYGTSGMVAWLVTRFLFRSKTNLKMHIHELLQAENLEQQKRIYNHIEPVLWGPFLSWLMKQALLMSLLGVPRSQINLINESEYRSVGSFVINKLRHVLTEVLIADNYFWRVYLTGSYTQACCPNYLRQSNFNRLKERVNKIQIYNSTITQFLKNHPGNYTHFILLDHQDWLAWHNPKALLEEWRLIFQNSAPGAKILMRSAGPGIGFLPESVRRSLQFFPDLTDRLHNTDRVGTYGSLHLAEVV